MAGWLDGPEGWGKEDLPLVSRADDLDVVEPGGHPGRQVAFEGGLVLDLVGVGSGFPGLDEPGAEDPVHAEGLDDGVAGEFLEFPDRLRADVADLGEPGEIAVSEGPEMGGDGGLRRGVAEVLPVGLGEDVSRSPGKGGWQAWGVGAGKGAGRNGPGAELASQPSDLAPQPEEFSEGLRVGGGGRGPGAGAGLGGRGGGCPGREPACEGVAFLPQSAECLLLDEQTRAEQAEACGDGRDLCLGRCHESEEAEVGAGGDRGGERAGGDLGRQPGRGGEGRATAEGHRERGPGGGDAPATQAGCQPLEGAFAAHACGILAQAEATSDFRVGVSLEMPEEQDKPVGIAKFHERVIEHRPEAAPVGFGVGGLVHRQEFVGLLLAVLASDLCPDPVGGLPVGGRVEPSDEGRVTGKAVGLPGEFDEDGLGDVGCGRGVPVQDPEGGGVDEIDVPVDELGEGILAVPLGEAPQQLGIIRGWNVGRHRHHPMPAGNGTARRKLRLVDPPCGAMG